MTTTKRKATTHTLIGHQLVVYQRGRSTVWQCRFNVSVRGSHLDYGSQEW